MNRLEYDKERGIPLEENLYEQSQTEIKQLLMKLFAVSLSSSYFWTSVPRRGSLQPGNYKSWKQWDFHNNEMMDRLLRSLDCDC